MKKFVEDYSQPVRAKQHESKLQHLRHERKAESEHLDGLKKTLQAKLSDPQEQVA